MGFSMVLKKKRFVLTPLLDFSKPERGRLTMHENYEPILETNEPLLKIHRVLKNGVNSLDQPARFEYFRKQIEAMEGTLRCHEEQCTRQGTARKT